MKKLQKTILAASLMLIAFSSCKKEATSQPVTDPVSATKISKIENSNGATEIGYNTDGSLKQIISKLPTGNIIAQFDFNYANNQIKEVVYGSTKIQYSYTAGFVTKVERANTQGVIMHRNEFSYNNTQLTETTEYWPNGTGGLRPFSKTIISYNNGNVAKLDLYDFINNTWTKTGEIGITEYDAKKNTSILFENPIYLPNVELSKNNPLKEVHKNELGTIVQTVTHSYLYDSSNTPIQRTRTTKTPGAADVVDITKFFY